MKKIKYLLFSASTFLMSFPVLAAKKAKGCSSSDDTNACSVIVKCMDKKIPNTVHTVILAIQIVVPVLLVIFGMVDLVKATTSGKEDEIKKAQNVFLRRLLMGVLVFFVIAIVKVLVSFAGNFDNKMLDCMNAFLGGVDK